MYQVVNYYKLRLMIFKYISGLQYLPISSFKPSYTYYDSGVMFVLQISHRKRDEEGARAECTLHMQSWTWRALWACMCGTVPAGTL